MRKPTHVEYNVDNQTSILWIQREGEDQPVPREFYMRGGICWPVTIEIGGKQDVSGYAVMAGLEIKTGILWVFEEQPWVVVESILDEDHNIEFKGLAPWFRMLWSTYFARDFYWHQSKVLTKNYRLEVWRSQLIQPKPTFIHIDWPDDEAAFHSVWKQLKLNRLMLEGPTVEYLKAKKAGDKQVMPAVHAIQCLTVGLERYPYRGE